MELNEKNLNWITANKMVALIMFQFFVIGLLGKIIISQYETIIAKDDKENTRKEEVIKMYRDSYIMSNQIEKASRKFNDTTYETRETH